MQQQQFNDVSNILWRERQLLDLLIFKLEEEQLVMAAGRTRWLANATREVETVLGEIKRLELDRAVSVADLAHTLALGDAPSLGDIAEKAPNPWNTIFADHRRALLELAQEIDSVAQSNRELLTRGQQATREALQAMGDVGDVEVGAYTPSGTPAADRGLSLRLIDEAI